MFTFGQFYGHVGFIICIEEKQVARRFQKEHKYDPFSVDMGSLECLKRARLKLNTKILTPLKTIYDTSLLLLIRQICQKTVSVSIELMRS